MDAAHRLPNFLGLEGPFTDPDTSSVVLLPVPFERTTSYGQGTAHGPAAILEASHQVELFDDELNCMPYRTGISTQPAIVDRRQPASEYLEEVSTTCRDLLRADKFVVTLGGEHTLTQACVAAAAEIHGEIGVVQFDAHADLRSLYEEDRLSHACVMRRIHEMGIAHLGIGIRSLSPGEAEFLAERPELEPIWGRELEALTPRSLRARLEALPTKVYLTFDVDFFDPAVIPATGTPEPGGGWWWPTLTLLRTLFECKQIVAMDLVELAPTADQSASDFTIARLAYKCIAYRDAYRRSATRSAG